MIKEKVKDHIIGQMVESIEENGKKENKMDLDIIKSLKIQKRRKESGKKEKGYNGCELIQINHL